MNREKHEIPCTKDCHRLTEYQINEMQRPHPPVILSLEELELLFDAV